MSATPRTDKATMLGWELYEDYVVPASVALGLERDLAAANATIADMKAERDNLKALLAGTCNELQAFGCDSEEPGIYRDATVALGWT